MTDLTTVTDTEAVLHDGTDVRTYDGLAPGTDHELEGIAFRTLPDLGEQLATFTTVNDVHFGEEVCGVIEGLDVGPTFRSGPDEPPYPETMNAGAIAEMAALDPDAVVVKGDLTNSGTDDEYAMFLAAYATAFGPKLVHVRGNHDGYHGGSYAADPTQRLDLPGCTIALLDTTVPLETPGGFTPEQAEWLDELAASADRPVLVFGHHHVWSPDSKERPDTYFGILPEASERLVEVVARRPKILGYFAGHTHRNRVRRIRATGERPWVEVACVKDFPGTWAEYRVHEGGILQVHHRISTPDALAWSEQTRHMYADTYFGYAFGRLEDRCFAMCPAA